MSDFDEYIVHREPGQREKTDARQTCTGLQKEHARKCLTMLIHISIDGLN